MEREQKEILFHIYAGTKCVCGNVKIPLRWTCRKCRLEVSPEDWQRLTEGCDAHLNAAKNILDKRRIST